MMPTINRQLQGRNSWNPIYDSSEWKEILIYRSAGNIFSLNKHETSDTASSSMARSSTSYLQNRDRNLVKGNESSSQEYPEISSVTLTSSSECNIAKFESKEFAQNGDLRSNHLPAKNSDMRNDLQELRAKKHILVLRIEIAY